MFHAFAYTATGNTISNLEMTPIQDDILSIQNGHFLPANDMNLFGFYCGSTLASFVTLNTPTLRQVSVPRMIPVSNQASPFTDPNIVDLRSNPLTLKAVEEIQLLITLATNASPALAVALMLAGDRLDPVPRGDIVTLHGVSTTTVNATGWTSLNIIFDTILPAGRYALIGAQVVSATAIAHRFILKDQVPRPGFLSINALSNRTAWDYPRGGMGKIGEFTTITYPIMQVLCSAADNSHDVLWHIVRLS